MGREKRAKAERRRARAAVDLLKGEMERQGVFKRHRQAEIALQAPDFGRRWRAIVALREGTEREVQDLPAAHAVAIEVLTELGCDMADLRLTLNRTRDNRLNFFCRPDPTRILAQLQRAAA